MIGQLRGNVLAKTPPTLLLDVNGVGYEVHAPMSTFYALNDSPTATVTLLIHMVVREDAQLLYGFFSDNERQLFKSLIKVNGVGPKLALTLLSGMDVMQFTQCIHDNDSARLTQIPGIGKKTAERLIVEIKDRLSDININTTNHSAVSSSTQDAVSALTALGYKPQEATKTIKAVFEPHLSSEDLIKLALQHMTKGVTA